MFIDQNLQYWHELLQNSQKRVEIIALLNKISYLKNSLQRNNEIIWLSLFKFLTDNPMETGRWNTVEYADRKCTLYNLDVGDKYIYFLICLYFTTNGKLYIHQKYYSRPNIIKYQEHMAYQTKPIRKTKQIYKILINKNLVLFESRLFSTFTYPRGQATSLQRLPSVVQPSPTFGRRWMDVVTDVQCSRALL